MDSLDSNGYSTTPTKRHDDAVEQFKHDDRTVSWGRYRRVVASSPDVALMRLPKNQGSRVLAGTRYGSTYFERTI